MNHIVITNFKVKTKRGQLVTRIKKEDPDPHGRFFYTPYQLSRFRPGQKQLARQRLSVQELNTPAQDQLIAGIVNDLQHRANKQVLVYINGYVPLQKSHKLASLYDLDDVYVGSHTGIGKIIFLSWPGFGWPFGETHEAYQIGRNLYDKLLTFLSALSRQLHAAGGGLNLMVQSWGNRLIAGFASRIDQRLSLFNGQSTPLFDQIFLMAADLPNAALQPGGVSIAGRRYNLHKLKAATGSMHIFYDEQDFILSASKCFVEKGRERLGIRGFNGQHALDNIRFYDAARLNGTSDLPPVTQVQHGSCAWHLMGYLIEKGPKKIMHSNENIRHRYFVESPNVIQKVTELLNGVPVAAGNIT